MQEKDDDNDKDDVTAHNSDVFSLIMGKTNVQTYAIQ
jgi:hypothetical protein